MGVCYEASFGIGIEIEKIYFDDSLEDDCMEFFLDELLKDTPYEYYQYGSNYSEKPNTFIIILEDPFKDGYDITKKVKDMEIFLRSNNIDFEKIDVVGGLYIW